MQLHMRAYILYINNKCFNKFLSKVSWFILLFCFSHRMKGFLQVFSMEEFGAKWFVQCSESLLTGLTKFSDCLLTG